MAPREGDNPNTLIKLITGWFAKRVALFDADTGKSVSVETNGGLAVNIQDQHSRMLDLDFIRALGATTTTATINPDERVLSLTDATGFVAGNVIGLFNVTTGLFYFGEQIGAPSGNDITLDTPMDREFLSGSNVIRATRNLAVVGTPGAPIIYQIGPVGVGTAIEVDTTRITGYIQDDTAMDDAKFGGISALLYGIVLRQNNGVMTNIWNAKTNGRVALLSASDLSYTDKAPAGSNGLRFRNTFAGQEKHGVTVRLDPGDTLELLVQDDLSGLEVFNLMAQGHVVTD